jgi:adenylate cyclase
VVVGSVGDSRSPLRYAVVGTAVEVATQVQARTTELETTTLVTEATRAAVGDRMAVRECGTVCVKGLSVDVPVHELLDLRGQGDPE